MTTVSGQGDRSNLDNATFTVAAAGTLDLLGTSNTVNAGAGASIILISSGDNEIVNTVTGQDITVSNGTVNVAGIGGPVSTDVTDTVTLDQSGSFSVSVENGGVTCVLCKIFYAIS